MTSKKIYSSQAFSVMRRFAATVSIAALLLSTFAVGLRAQNMKAPAGKSAAKLSEDQQIPHVLNFTMKGMSKDNYFFGIRAVDKEGNRSPVSYPLLHLAAAFPGQD